MSAAMTRRYFAIVVPDDRHGFIGYALDYYPEEERAYRRGEGKNIVGDFATQEDAMKAARDAIKSRRRND